MLTPDEFDVASRALLLIATTGDARARRTLDELTLLIVGDLYFRRDTLAAAKASALLEPWVEITPATGNREPR